MISVCVCVCILQAKAHKDQDWSQLTCKYYVQSFFLNYFSLNLHFPKGRLFCVALVLVFFERLGDEYFSWWYEQRMLPYGTSISLYALM